uniref:Apple domain-containing protein n=1 Tax=Ascaris lumbricoides TaxID=6252 RepID=A0A0M3HVA3_ASCLU
MRYCHTVSVLAAVFSITIGFIPSIKVGDKAFILHDEKTCGGILLNYYTNLASAEQFQETCGTGCEKENCSAIVGAELMEGVYGCALLGSVDFLMNASNRMCYLEKGANVGILTGLAKRLSGSGQRSLPGNSHTASHFYHRQTVFQHHKKCFVMFYTSNIYQVKTLKFDNDKWSCFSNLQTHST